MEGGPEKQLAEVDSVLTPRCQIGTGLLDSEGILVMGRKSGLEHGFLSSLY